MKTSWLWRGFVVCGLLLVLAGFGAWQYFSQYAERANSYDLDSLRHLNVSTLFYDRNGHELGSLFIENRIVLSHNEIPDRLRIAVLAAEDQRFYQHHGIDWKGTLRAAWRNLRAHQAIQGGSTISQQLAKHLIGDFTRNFERKWIEAFLARRIESHFSKDEILDLYLNRIYFGKGYFGVEAAARGYFGKSARSLSWGECALLAGIIKSPSSSSPRTNLERALTKRNLVLSRLRILGKIDRTTFITEIQSPLHLAASGHGGIRSYFMAWAAEEARQILQVNDIDDIPGGLKIETTLDSNAEALITQELHENLAHHNSPTGETVSNELQTAVICLDPDSGAVRVMIGGNDFQRSPYNRAVYARRDFSALLDPILYARAFDQRRLSPATMIKTGPLTSPKENPLGDFQNDANGSFITAQDALSMRSSGPRERIQALLNASLSKVIGSKSDHFSLLEVCSFYQALISSGKSAVPYAIQKIQDSSGNILYHHNSSPTALWHPEISDQMIATLIEIARTHPESPAHVSGNPESSLQWLDVSTSQSDLWSIGWNRHLVCGLWLGCDTPQPVFSDKKIRDEWAVAGKNILPLAFTQPAEPFPHSPLLTAVEIDQQTGSWTGPGLIAPQPGHLLAYLLPENLKDLHRQSPDWKIWWTSFGSSSNEASFSSEPVNRAGIPEQVQFRLPALRGDILSVDGERLATTVENQNLLIAWPNRSIAPDEKTAVAWMWDKIVLAERRLGSPEQFTNEQLVSLYRHRRFEPVTVLMDLSLTQVKTFHQSDLPSTGFFLQGVPRRVYPYGKTLAHILGHLQRTQAPASGDFQSGEVIYDDYAGDSGIEKWLDRELIGTSGEMILNTDRNGYAAQWRINQKATRGINARTTIDSRLQGYVEKALEPWPCSAMVVIDCRDGDIVAISSRPNFDPNIFVPSLPENEWQALVQNPRQPLLSRAYQVAHPPGSVFKVVTSIASMKRGVFSPDRVVDCPGFFEVGNIRYNLPRENHPVSFQDALALSFNTYFFDLGLRTGREALIDTARSLGLGSITGFGLPGEASGLVPDPDFVLAHHQRDMGPGDVTNTAIGQGDVLVTPLQMANVMAAIANGGTLFKPRLLRQTEDETGAVIHVIPVEILRENNFSGLPLNELRQAMVEVVERGTGTSAHIPDVPMAAKTGTAQVGSKENPKQVAWLAGYVPARHPIYSFAVMIEGDPDQDLHGGSDAGPVAASVFSHFFENQKFAQKE